MTYQTPCSSPENDPDDWFIGRDGRQYPDDELRIVEGSEEESLRQALRRRRHARDACFADCLVRLQCLDVALKNREHHGTWGGYTEDQLRVLQTEIAKRKK